jgi:hypothetical protein
MRRSLHSYFFVLLFSAISMAPCLAEDPPPTQARKLLIEDGEFLKYADFLGGERYNDVNIVSRISADGKTIKVYVGNHFIGTNIPMPRNYTDYQRQYVISLETASMINSFADFYKEYLAENKTGEVAYTTVIDTVKNVAIYTSKIWDGYDLRTKTTRVKLRPDYPVWDPTSIAFIGSRFLDLSGKGIVYGVFPMIVKDAVPISAHFIKKETIDTPLGRFNTLRYGLGIMDPFLAQLLDSYVKEMSIWIEDAPRGLVIKTEAPGDSFLLEEISTWAN